MVTDSWYAWLPLRTRVSMSAIGSVMVMVLCSIPAVVSPRYRVRGTFGHRVVWLPAALGDAGELAAVCHLAQADAAEAELAVDRLRPTTTLAPGVGAHGELGLLRCLVPESGLRHVSSP